MTNRETYKQAFSALHPSGNIHLEGTAMKSNRIHFIIRPVAAVLACVILLFGCATVAYAADIGGIRTTIQTWVHGKQTPVDVTEVGGGYKFSYSEGGETKSVTGGGIAFDQNGNEIPLTPEEIAEATFEEIGRQADGRIWLYYKSYAIDITDHMTGAGCRLVLDDGGAKVYFDIDAPNELGSCSYRRAIGSTENDPQDYTPIH